MRLLGRYPNSVGRMEQKRQIIVSKLKSFLPSSPATTRQHRRRRAAASESPCNDAGPDFGGSGASAMGDKVMEGARGRRTTSDCLEADLAIGQTRRPRHLSNITKRRRYTKTVETCSNHPTQEARQR
ncbi:Protein RTA1 [Fusarium oxysporum f. sp. albedinis]|nr:Protein RTA1 [Fusarium oxysporum f. sp. albedinis]